MAWRDSLLNSPPDRDKLLYLIACIDAIYSGTPATAFRGGETNLVLRRSANPRCWTWDYQGEKICVLEGAGPEAADYLSVSAGWIAPVPRWGGLINSRVSLLCDDIYASLPSGTSVIAGHSLGGCVAAAIARRFKDAAAVPVPVAISYGSPRWYLGLGAGSSLWPFVINVSHVDDPVVWMPANSVLDFPEWSPWTRPGNVWKLDLRNGLTAWQQPSNTNAYLLYLLSVSLTRHFTLTYVQSLRGADETILRGGEAVAAYFYEVAVNGSMNGRPVGNIINYAVAGTAGTAERVLKAFAAIWRPQVMYYMSARYRVKSFVCRRVEGVVFKELLEGETVLHNLWRYGNKFGMTGLASDVGGWPGSTLPNFVAVGVRKVTTSWYRSDYATPVPLFRSPKGGFRIGAVVEEAVDDDDRVAVTDPLGPRGSWLDRYALMAGSLRKFDLPSPGITAFAQMIVMAKESGGKAILTGPGGSPEFYVADVQACLINQYITSQNSRKNR